MKRRKYLIGILVVIGMMTAGSMFLTQRARAFENEASPEVIIPVATEPSLPEIVIPVATETPEPAATPDPTVTPEPTKTPEPEKVPPVIFHVEALDDCVSYNEKGKLSFDKEGIAEFLNGTYNKYADKARSAKIAAGDTEYYIQKHVKGKQVDVEKLLKDLKPSVKRIKLKDYYIQPEVKAADLKEDCKKLNRYVNWYVQYDNGSVIKAGMENVRYKNGKICLKKAFLKDAVKKVLASYNEADHTGYFVTHAGKKIKMDGGTFKITTDYAKELTEVLSLYENAKSQKKRTPIYTSSSWDRYIEVSLSEQHLWYMENGKVKRDTPVVTGTNTNPDRKTPTGIYKIIERIPGKYLVGPGYRTWVNQWMRLTWSGIGLHDAYWRPASDFVPGTYQYNGSHGCINLPKDFAAWLYPNTFDGMVVVIY